jgi:hypothetical protein
MKDYSHKIIDPNLPPILEVMDVMPSVGEQFKTLKKSKNFKQLVEDFAECFRKVKLSSKQIRFKISKSSSDWNISWSFVLSTKKFKVETYDFKIRTGTAGSYIFGVELRSDLGHLSKLSLLFPNRKQLDYSDQPAVLLEKEIRNILFEQGGYGFNSLKVSAELASDLMVDFIDYMIDEINAKLNGRTVDSIFKEIETLFRQAKKDPIFGQRIKESIAKKDEGIRKLKATAARKRIKKSIRDHLGDVTREDLMSLIDEVLTEQVVED